MTPIMHDYDSSKFGVSTVKFDLEANKFGSSLPQVWVKSGSSLVTKNRCLRGVEANLGAHAQKTFIYEKGLLPCVVAVAAVVD